MSPPSRASPLFLRLLFKDLIVIDIGTRLNISAPFNIHRTLLSQGFGINQLPTRVEN